jgi:hypothetical protein
MQSISCHVEHARHARLRVKQQGWNCSNRDLKNADLKNAEDRESR